MPHGAHFADCTASPEEPCSCETRRYWHLIGITSIIAVIQSAGGLISGSIALWADTLHVLLDAVGEGIALYIAYHVHSKSDPQAFRVAGMRLSGGILLVAIAWNAYEALMRFADPPAVAGWQVMLAAGIGTALNAYKHRIVAHDHSVNADAERLHIFQDLALGLAVVLGGLLIWITGVRLIDPVLSLLIVVYLAYSTIRLMASPPVDADACGHLH